MKIPTVNKFLGCVELFQGALFLGYVSAICNGLYAVLLLVDIAFDADGLKHEMLSISRPRQAVETEAVDYSLLNQDDSKIFDTPIKLPDMTKENVEDIPKDVGKTSRKGLKKVHAVSGVPTPSANLTGENSKVKSEETQEEIKIVCCRNVDQSACEYSNAIITSST